MALGRLLVQELQGAPVLLSPQGNPAIEEEYMIWKESLVSIKSPWSLETVLYQGDHVRDTPIPAIGSIMWNERWSDSHRDRDYGMIASALTQHYWFRAIGAMIWKPQREVKERL